MTDTVEPIFVGVDDAANILGLGRSKFYELVASKDLRLVKLGRRSLVPVASLKEFAATITKRAA